MAKEDSQQRGTVVRLPTVVSPPRGAPDEDGLSSIEQIIAEAAAGRMFVLVDDEDRENEGDLVIPAGFASPAAINFMARHGRGLICMTMTQERANELGLPLMNPANGTRHQTAFTVSIEARQGVTTGISAADRARTIAVAIDPAARPHDLVTPGHVFPIVARNGGCLVRAGHTEASVDISRLAGLDPSAVICEIMNEDGTMARLPELLPFARAHGLKIGTIADLIAYRRRTERLVERREEVEVDHPVGGRWRLLVYATSLENVEHLVLVKGDLAAPGPVMVRMHSVDLANDILGMGKWSVLHGAMRTIAEDGRGVVVVLRDTRANVLSEHVRNLVAPSGHHVDLRDYGIGAQILTDLGIHEMILLSNTHSTIRGIDGYGLSVVDQIPVDPAE